jgi:hypothetical protein
MSSNLVDVRFQQRANGADAGIVDQRGDPGVIMQQAFDPAKIGLVVEVCRNRLDLPAGRFGKTFCECIKTALVARHEDQVVAAVRQTVGIDGADA